MVLIACQTLLGVVDTALLVYAWRKRKQFAAYGAPPLLHALGLFFAALLLHTAAMLPLTLNYDIHDVYGRALVLWHFLLFGLLPMWCYGRIVLDVIASSVAGFVFGMRTVRPMRNDFGRARRLMIAGDVEGAARVYRDYFDEAPDDPHPLFELAGIFEGQSRHEAAAALYREIRQRFQGHTTQWAKATYFLALLLEDELGDPQAAVYHYEEILRRASKTTYAQFARTRLAEALKPSLN